MFLDDEDFSWGHAGVWATLFWVVQRLAANVHAGLPWNVPWLPVVAPLLVVFLAGVHERGDWWICGSLVTLVPPVILLGGVVAVLTAGGVAAGAASGILILAGWLMLASFAVAIVAALGVWAGKTLAVRGGDER